jgi:coenzyme F420 biosynthesis associated uncharacterized protein
VVETNAEPVAWDVASRVARQALKLSPQSLSADHLDRLQRDFADATVRAQDIVEDLTGLRSRAGVPRAAVLDRAGWVDANVLSFKRLLEPLSKRLLANEATRRAMNGANRAIAGVEVGLLLSWMSSRVLGQYDLLPFEDGDGDVIYYVGPNVVNIESRHGFAPSEFRLWIALHEVTHRLQFTAVPWMRDYFLGLVERGTAFGVPSTETVLDALRRAVEEIRAGRNPLSEGGVIGLLASSEQLATLREAQAFMSVLEGHGNTVMSLASDDLIPGAQRFARVLAERRKSASPLAKAAQQALGFEAKMRQYSEGERFVRTVLDTAGKQTFDRIWEGPEMLPSIEEIRDPLSWTERVGGLATARG